MSLADPFGLVSLGTGRAGTRKDSGLLHGLARQIAAMRTSVQAEPQTMAEMGWQAGYLSLWGDASDASDGDEPESDDDDLKFF